MLRKSLIICLIAGMIAGVGIMASAVYGADRPATVDEENQQLIKEYSQVQINGRCFAVWRLHGVIQNIIEISCRPIPVTNGNDTWNEIMKVYPIPAAGKSGRP